MEKVRLAVVGCGAVTELFHLPALVSAASVEIVCLVDARLSRAEALAHRFGVARAVADYRALQGQADAALLALPNHLHAPITNDLLGAGLHVLIEKPMARTRRECDGMLAAAAGSGRVLAVAHVKRFFPSSLFARHAIQSGMLGTIQSIDWREGAPYRWSISSDFAFRKEVAGGGVLIDGGAHVLDLIVWWCGETSVIEYLDDAEGGVEADCQLRLRCGSAECTVELSRTRTLRNSCIIRGTRGTLEVPSEYDPSLRLTLADANGAPLVGQVVDTGARGRPAAGGWPVHAAFRDQFESFAVATRGGATHCASGAEGARVVGLIEQCYAVRKPLPQPWFSPSREAV